MNDLLTRVEADMRAQDLLRARRAAVVAVSGGLDSMVLLEALLRLAPGYRWRLSVAHFNHGLRGRQSDADERLVRETATRRKLPFVAERADVNRLAAGQGLSIEMAAREARHQFLARTARAQGIRTIALAHQADDQVELFFLRLLRGAGALGLAGMRWVAPSPADAGCRLIRPLLGRPRAELEAFARAEGVPFRNDASNASMDVLRNRVRHELLPLLERHYQPGLRAVILREMETLEAEAGLVGELARTWRGRKRGARFQDLAVAVQRRVLCDELVQLGVDPTFERVEQLRRQADRPVTVASGRAVRREGTGRVGWVPGRRALPAFVDDEARVWFRGPSGQGVFNGVAWSWRIRATQPGRVPAFGRGWEWFDADKVGREVRLRHWRPGDRFQPSGMGRPVKLQDLLTNLKIPQDRRRELVLATTAQGAIWWVEGLRIAEQFKLGPGTKRRLRWGWTRGKRSEG